MNTQAQAQVDTTVDHLKSIFSDEQLDNLIHQLGVYLQEKSFAVGEFDDQPLGKL